MVRASNPFQPPSSDRAALMRRVRQKDTAPEVALRKLLYARGYRFRLHPDSLPGRPDIAMPKHRAVVFVHGCFWHGHRCHHGRQISKSNTSFWVEKIDANRKRDARKTAALRKAGWRVVVVWECEVKRGQALRKVTTALA